MGWDNPIFIIGMFLGAMGIAILLIRVSSPKSELAFECQVCGRKQRARSAGEWRYCPYCGAPRDARSTRHMPRRGRSVLDIE